MTETLTQIIYLVVGPAGLISAISTIFDIYRGRVPKEAKRIEQAARQRKDIEFRDQEILALNHKIEIMNMKIRDLEREFTLLKRENSRLKVLLKTNGISY